MSTQTVRVTDNTDSARVAVVHADAVAPVIGGWLAADAGAFTVDVSPNVVALARALRHGDWARVHALADHLSMSVEVLR